MLTKVERVKRREMLLMFYSLERKWGIPADLYKSAIGEPDYESGVPVTTNTKYRLPKLITHSIESQHKFEYDLSFLAANKNFTYGGLYEPGDRLAMFSGRGLPEDLTVDMQDYIVYDGKRYNIQKVEKLDYSIGFILHLRHTKDQKPYQTHERAVWTTVRITQEITNDAL